MSSRHFYALFEAPAATQPPEGPGAFSKWPEEVAGSRPEREHGVRGWAPFQPSQPELQSLELASLLQAESSEGTW